MFKSQRDGDADARDRILRAAAEEIAASGWGGVRIRAVAERAGVNVAMPHYYFGSREALLKAATLALLEAEFREPGELLLRARSLQEAVQGMIGWIGRYDPAAPAHRVFGEALLEVVRDEALRVQLGPILAGFRARLTELAASGSLPPGAEPAGAAAVLAATMDGLLLHRVSDPATDLAAAARTLAALLDGRRPAGDGGDTR
ncbi:MAG TPA: TetR family transcriptional regulator [Dehalococcoidia bacterium]|nr:TetR family transcriptional regulator [Dehalococcoidia bacterium]